MNRSIWVLCFAIFMQAIPSWGWDTVIVGDKEWYRVADMKGLCHEDFNTACPGGICTGSLAGNNLTGWIWASVDDVNDLFNHYIGSDELNGPSEYRDYNSTWGAAIVDDFGTNADGFIFLTPSAIGRTSTGFYIGYGTTTARAGAQLGNSGADTSKVYFEPPCALDVGAWLYHSVDASTEAFTVSLEEPINGEIHSGVGNLRGWAVAEEGIDKVEIYIDGEYAFDAPYGGTRMDVGDQYPDITGSDDSGFSLAFGYSILGAGEHTITARALTLTGDSTRSTSTFNVEAFHKEFINPEDIVDTSQATMTSGMPVNQFSLDNVWIDGWQYDLILEWRTAEQGFEIIFIEPENDGEGF